MRKRLIQLVVVGALALSALGVGASTSSAACGGTSCLPGSGYGADYTYNCGLILNAHCYANGTTSYGSATFAGWGWGSADYDGGGSVYICVQSSNGIQGFSWCGYNLARACFNTNCNDQDTYTNMYMRVSNLDNNRHTIKGHGKA